MADETNLKNLSYYYAQSVAESNQHESNIAYIPAGNDALLAAIVRILEENSFKCIRAEGQIGAALRQFAGLDHSFTTPIQTLHTPDLSAVLNTEDAPAGWVQALQIISRTLGPTATLIVEAQWADEQFLECYKQTTMDTRLVILGEAPADESGECRQ